MTIFGTRGGRKVRRPQVAAVYCGRSSPPGYPFVTRNERMRDAVCDQYEAWFERHRSSRISYPAFRRAWTKLKQTAAAHKHLFLQCHGAPKRCHCDTTKRALEEKNGLG